MVLVCYCKVVDGCEKGGVWSKKVAVGINEWRLVENGRWVVVGS
jgi:hypothetical protein